MSHQQTRTETADTAAPAIGRSRNGGPSRATFLRRRLAFAGVLAVLVAALLLATGFVGAEAELVDPVAGHVVVEPGETLWDVAVATADHGMDPRRQLEALRELNGIEGSQVRGWDVILIPAR